MTVYAWKAISGDWTSKADWTPNGSPVAGDSAEIGAAGTYVVTVSTAVSAGVVALKAAGATLSDSGVLTLSGGAKTLSVTAGTFKLNSGGSVAGGTIVAGASGHFAWDGGTLNAVTYDGVLALAGGTVHIANRITLHGATGTGLGTIDVTGLGARLNLVGAVTLNNADVVIGSGTAATAAAITGTAMTFGPVLTLTQSSTKPYAAVTASTSLRNEGAINLGTLGGHFTLTTGAFSNAGSLTASNGEALQLHDGSIANTASGTLTVSGAGSTALLDSTAAFSNAGAVTLSAKGALTINANVVNTGQLSASGGALTINGAVSGTGGTVLLSNSGAARFDGTVQSSQSVIFLDATGTLQVVLSNPNSFAADIDGFQSAIPGLAAGDKIDLVGTAATTISSAGATAEGVELVVKDGTTLVANLQLIGNYVGQTFEVASDLHGGTDITLKPPTPAAAALHLFAQAAAAFGAFAVRGESSPISEIATARSDVSLGAGHAVRLDHA
jgi:hypothetical protein